MGKMEAKYMRVYETLKRDILSGKYSSRNPFPSVAMIIRRFAISNLTAVKVLEKLKNDGLVKSYQGRGTFVTNNATSREIGLIVPGVACTDFFQPIVSEINQLATPPFSRTNCTVLVSVNMSDTMTAAALDRWRSNSYGRDKWRPDGDYAVSYTKSYGKGRVFYTSFGHDGRAFCDERLAHMALGLQWVLGDISE